MKRPQLAVLRAAALACLALLLAILSAERCQAAVTVWVDFTSDIHNGAGGGPNGTADWIDELGKATSSAGVTAFSPGERSVLEADILSQLATIYADYDVTFTTTAPGVGAFDAIAYGKDSTGFGSLGIAPSDPGNISSSQVGGIATGNFDFILDEFSGVGSRATQISQLATALAGTGAHELGHTFGLFHHHAYSDPSITPATYGATGGAQNAYIMGTGPTGLDELGRETLRGFSPWEKAMFDVAGGAGAAYPGPLYDHHSLVTTPVSILLAEVGPPDVGPTPLTAFPVGLTPGETSGMDLALVAGDLDGSPADVDFFKFFLPKAGLLTAEVFSSNRFGPPFNFDPFLALSGPGPGGPIIAANDDVFFDGDVYDALTFRQNDPFLLNIFLGPGEYFLNIHAVLDPMAPPEHGDAYWLMIGVTPVPEPATLGLLVAGTAMLLLRRRR